MRGAEEGREAVGGVGGWEGDADDLGGVAGGAAALAAATGGADDDDGDADDEAWKCERK